MPYAYSSPYLFGALFVWSARGYIQLTTGNKPQAQHNARPPDVWCQCRARHLSLVSRFYHTRVRTCVCITRKDVSPNMYLRRQRVVPSGKWYGPDRTTFRAIRRARKKLAQCGTAPKNGMLSPLATTPVASIVPRGKRLGPTPTCPPTRSSIAVAFYRTHASAIRATMGRPPLRLLECIFRMRGRRGDRGRRWHVGARARG